jgi:hypothetical protein
VAVAIIFASIDHTFDHFIKNHHPCSQNDGEANVSHKVGWILSVWPNGVVELLTMYR